MLSLIAAVSRNGIIGKEGTLPWKCSSDLRHFRDLTIGKTVVMGRKTFESIGRPLPDRRNIIISKTMGQDSRIGSLAGLEIIDDLTLLDIFGKDDDVFIIGGKALYNQFLGAADRMYITKILADVDGDTSFPDVNWGVWKAIDENPEIVRGESDQYSMQFFTYNRY